ncbi:hypothetical protein NAPIS_ORF02612 [Vairimorpha apis BRL 01]|uniref:Microsporidial 8TM transmembrane domain-containing protein n=1 Tax=Vairimorpha apis BRL 01 TaxID=1037528 RepID=T0M8Q6_9MICR|nr:hypothetical protein NAPIS_ORF02612 [Vairimorpha apis BRL 01]
MIKSYTPELVRSPNTKMGDRLEKQVSFYLSSYTYFFITLFLPKDISSLENLLLCLTDYDPVFIDLLQFVSFYYLPVCNNFYFIDVGEIYRKKSVFNFDKFKEFLNSRSVDFIKGNVDSISVDFIKKSVDHIKGSVDSINENKDYISGNKNYINENKINRNFLNENITNRNLSNIDSQHPTSSTSNINIPILQNSSNLLNTIISILYTTSPTFQSYTLSQSYTTCHIPTFNITCDIIVSFYLSSYTYFFITLFLPKDISSLENLLLCLTDYDPVFIDLLQFVSFYYLPVCNNFYFIDVGEIYRKKSVFNFDKFKEFLNSRSVDFIKGNVDSISVDFIKKGVDSFNENKINRNFLNENITNRNLSNIDSQHPTSSTSNINIPILQNSSNLLNTIISILYTTTQSYTLSQSYTISQSYTTCHIPTFNITWFIYTTLFKTHSSLIYKILLTTYFYSNLKLKNMKFILFFKPSSFRNYLIYIYRSKYLFLYLCFYFLYVYIEVLVFYIGVGNLNFLNWCCVLVCGLFLLSESEDEVLNGCKVVLNNRKNNIFSIECREYRICLNGLILYSECRDILSECK